MNSNTREKIVKSWSGISEVALIKEVATKGEHIQLCIEYWAKKRKMAVSEYHLFFHDVVQAYVQRLLNERLVHKADNVLKNVQRDIKSFYFQFACECDDDELREMIIEYLRKRDTSQQFETDLLELRFYWDLLQQLKETPAVMSKYKDNIRRMNIDMIMKLEPNKLKRLVVELYFDNHNCNLIEHLNMLTVWEYFVETGNVNEILKWCSCMKNSAIIKEAQLEVKYGIWLITTEMFEYALKNFKNPSEPLRNCLASEGYFFKDERDNVDVVLKRICTTGSFTKNQESLEKIPIGKYLLDHSYYSLMLENFVSSRELEELADSNPDQENLLKFLVALKSNNLEEREGFEKISFATKVYLESRGIDFQNEQSLVSFHEFLCNEPSLANLNCFVPTSGLKHIPFLTALVSHLDSNSHHSTNIPTPYDLLRKFRKIDFSKISTDSKDINNCFDLSDQYAKTYNLNFLHYIKQHRSAYAVYFFFIDKLKQYSQITNGQLFSACETVIEFALQHSSDEDDILHAIGFIEMLGFDSQNLRTFLKLCRSIDDKSSINAMNFNLLIGKVEEILVECLNQQCSLNAFPYSQYKGLMKISACNQNSQWPQLILQHYAKEDHWWHLLILFQHFEIPITVLKQLVNFFNNKMIGKHLLRALSYDPIIPFNERSSKRNANFARYLKKNRRYDGNNITTSAETVTNVSNISYIDTGSAIHLNSLCNKEFNFFINTSSKLDLFAIILLSKSNISEVPYTDGVTKIFELAQESQSNLPMSLNLLKNCIKHRLPILSILAATVNSSNISLNWVVWLIISTNQWNDFIQKSQKDSLCYAWTLIENSIRLGFTNVLYRSFCIFYEDNKLKHLMEFLHRTQTYKDFSKQMINELRMFLIAWSNNEITEPFNESLSREQIMQRSIRCLLIHLEKNFNSTFEQQKFLSLICQSDINDISSVVDFNLLHDIFNLLQNMTGWSQKCQIHFEKLIQTDNKIYEGLLAAWLEAKAYNEAIHLASKLNMPICDMMYNKWVTLIDSGTIADVVFERCEEEIVEHSLPPEILVNFFLYAASRLNDIANMPRKYQLLKRALNVIKKNHLFPNESFDRDQIEYDMIVCYLQIENLTQMEPLDIYHSEYYEQIMLKERCVLYKSFVELKELAGIEDLNANRGKPIIINGEIRTRLENLLNQLLDEGDIVEALRLQELFEYRPVDLRFVVFCMALAEGVTTIFNMSIEERNLLRDIEKSSFAKFNKRTLSYCSSPVKLDKDLSDSCSILEFEEIPSKEKRETLDTIQGIASKLKHGVDIAKRILMSYRAAMYLDKEYLDILRTKDVSVLLKSIAEEECLHRLLVVSDIMTSTHMSSQEIAELLALEITTAVVRPRFYIFSTEQQTRNTFKNANLWGYNIDRDLHLFLELTPNSTQLGNCLLEYCDALKSYRKFQDDKPYSHTVVFEKLAEIITKYGLPTNASPASTNTSTPPQVLSHKKQNLIYVELLIKAHQCFVHECSTEGISNVLHRAKILNGILTRAKSWSLIVRMLIGIARYREMFFCFDTLIENEQFESLLGQFDEAKTIGLRQAIISYIKEYNPVNGRELLKLSALHFLMYKDLAEMWEEDAHILLEKVLSIGQVAGSQLSEQISMTSLITAVPVKTILPKLKSSEKVIELLSGALENYTHATENYLLENKLILAQKSVAQAELVAMQIDLCSKSQERSRSLGICILKLSTHDDLRELINSELNVPQSIIIGRSYGYDIQWWEPVLFQYVIQMKKMYINEYMNHFMINDSLVNNVVKGFLQYCQYHVPNAEMEEHMAFLIGMVKSITLKYKLASLINLKGIVTSLINGQTSYYLCDTNYGRSERQTFLNL